MSKSPLEPCFDVFCTSPARTIFSALPTSSRFMDGSETQGMFEMMGAIGLRYCVLTAYSPLLAYLRQHIPKDGSFALLLIMRTWGLIAMVEIIQQCAKVVHRKCNSLMDGRN